MMSPSSTKRAPSCTSAPAARRSSIALWCVIARRPVRIPASASSIAPVHTEPTRRPRRCRSRESRGDHAALRLVVRPGPAAVVPAAAGHEHQVRIAEHAVRHDPRAAGGRDRRPRPRPSRTARRSPAVLSTSNGPNASRSSNPSNRRISIVMRGIVAAAAPVRRVAGMPMSVTILPSAPRRRPRPRRGRPARPRDPRAGLRHLRGDAVPRHRVRRDAGRARPPPGSRSSPRPAWRRSRTPTP